MIQSNLIFPGFLWNMWIHAKFYLIVFVPEIRYFWLKYFSGFVVVFFFLGGRREIYAYDRDFKQSRKKCSEPFPQPSQSVPATPRAALHSQACVRACVCVCVCVCVCMCVCEYISPWLSWLFSLCFCCNALIVWSSVWITGQLWEGAELGFILHSCRRN